MRTSAMARLAVMGVLLLALMIPLTMTHAVVSERAGRRDEAAREISGVWGGAQTLGGPVLVIPYRYSTADNQGRPRQHVGRIAVLPESLEVEGVVSPGVRARGLFEVIVYDARLKARGRFPRPDLAQVRPAPEEVLWADAAIDIGIADPKGIAGDVALSVNGRALRVAPGVGESDLFSSGLRAAAPDLFRSGAEPADADFELAVDLRGTRELRVMPAGNDTTVRLSSSWPHPSFVGAPLPAARRVDASGFSASWRMPYYGRGYPPQWTRGGADESKLRAQAAASAFGVTLVQPVDIYQQSERAVKYAALFIVLTFVIAFVWEIGSGTLVHPIQYLFVGFAMCVFYLLLVSLAEHVRFDPAYAAAAGATIALIAWYWSWVLHGVRHGVLMAGALTLLYGYLYLLLRLEDFALLAGSVGLFLVLGVLMFVTRRVNWYELRLGTRIRQES
jgi:inner membrane protein